MQTIERLEEFPRNTPPVVLTVGNFDGMHRGHLAVLQKLKSLAGKEKRTCILTFSEHPSRILRPDRPTFPISTLSHRLRLIEECDIDFTICIPFTSSVAALSPASFIERLQNFIPFTDIVLGFDATLGKNKQGNRETMQALAEKAGFQIFYAEEYRYPENRVSSTIIRNALASGNLQLVSDLLNRPYSIYGSVIRGSGTGAKFNFPTANLDVTGLSLPPYGVYAVDMIKDGRRFEGIANLGIAPTVRSSKEPLLEVHLFDRNENPFYDRNVEVIFKTFIRAEKCFSSSRELCIQIEKDIAYARRIGP